MLLQPGVAAVRHAVLLTQQVQSLLGFAQTAAYVKKVTGARAIAAQRSAARNLAYDGNVDEDFVALRGIAAGEKAIEAFRCAPQAAQEFRQPRSCCAFGKRQTQKKATRSATHGGNIADRACQGFPAHGVRGMLVAQEMRVFKKPVAGKNCFAAARWLEQSRVIADAERQLTRRSAARTRDFSCTL